MVTLDLASILNNVASRLGLPSGIASKLPPSVANLTIFKSDQLKYVQNGGKAIKGLALWLTIIVPLLYVLALFLAKGHRRRTLMTIGFAGILAGVLVILGRSILQGQVANSLTSDASLQVTIRHVYNISTAILKDVAGAVISLRSCWSPPRGSPGRPARRIDAPRDRSVPARTGRADLRDRARDHGSRVRVEPDRSYQQAARESWCSPRWRC